MPLILERKPHDRKRRGWPPVLLACALVLPLVLLAALLVTWSVAPGQVTLGGHRWRWATWTLSPAVSRVTGLPYGWTYIDAPNDGTDSWMLEAGSWVVVRVERTRRRTVRPEGE
jgi:hypothetical protein